jgi:hypothetical protein
MNSALYGQARSLFRVSLVIFLVTIVIGILNGLDVWEPERKLLLTHVHAGTLGWITLAVTGVALLMFGKEGDADSARKVANAMIGATSLYVLAWATTTGILRPIAGTLMLLAIVNTFAWVMRRRASAPRTVPALALYLAFISLVIGAILGVLLGLFIANGSLPGLSTEMAGNLAGAHPPAMLAGYLALAGFAIAEWRLSSQPALASESKVGTATAYGLFLAGLLFNVAIIFNIEPLLQVASMLQVIAVVVFVVRMWSNLKPSAWSVEGSEMMARWAVVYLAVGIAILVYVVQLFVSGKLDPETGEGPVGVLVAFDHALFIGLMTNALFSTIWARRPWDGSARLIMWGVNIPLAGFLLGLMIDSSLIKRISTPIMGAALLYAVYVGLMGREEPASSGA